jgi:hypothetical protein
LVDFCQNYGRLCSKLGMFLSILISCACNSSFIFGWSIQRWMKSCMHKIWEWTGTYPIWSINGHNSGKNQPTVKSVRSSVPISCVRNYSFIFLQILIIFGMIVGHDVRMRRLYQFHGWLNFARVMKQNPSKDEWRVACTRYVNGQEHTQFGA